MSLTTTPTPCPLPVPSSPATTAPASLPRAKAGPSPRRARGRNVLVGLLVLLALAGTAWGARRWLWPGEATATELTATVTRGDLPIVVTERGELESSKTIIAKCEVETEQIKIVDILPE